MRKVHGIDVVLPRELKIEEEEQSTPKKTSGPSFFNDYERQWSIKHFWDPEVKYIRSHQNYQRALKQYYVILKELRACTESKFVANVTRDKMAIYDSTKDQHMEKFKLKVVVATESYVSMKLQRLVTFKMYDCTNMLIPNFGIAM